ncbi:DISP1 [Symbiodinium sp. CCMP2456]|nr:DISP1 [Symbiodinium sp. CCMP2456]
MPPRKDACLGNAVAQQDQHTTCAPAELNVQPLKAQAPLKGSCIPCWLFFALGWFFTLLFINEASNCRERLRAEGSIRSAALLPKSSLRRDFYCQYSKALCNVVMTGFLHRLLPNFTVPVMTQGTDIFSFDDPAVETDLKVQQYFGFQAALDETPGCGDQAHAEKAVCEADELCEWVQRGPSASCRDIECPGPTPKRRQNPLYLDFLPAFISVLYEAVEENGNILDDDIMRIIFDYEQELFTDVGGAELNYEDEIRPSPWTEDWCLMSHPSHGYGEPKCASGVGFGHMFTLNDAGRETIKNQALAGHNYLGLAGMMACICQNEETCLVCNADGSMKGAPPGRRPVAGGELQVIGGNEGFQGHPLSLVCSWRGRTAESLQDKWPPGAILEKMCDPSLPLWWNAKHTDCTWFEVAWFVIQDEGKKFQTGYVEGRNGWCGAKYEREHGSKLRIMLFSGATLVAQYLGILLVDGFLSLGSLVFRGCSVSVWAYMWLMLESVFLASCGMFEIIFSLPVGMCLWVLAAWPRAASFRLLFADLRRLVIYMILGIGADDVFILYDAWLQSAHADGVSHSRTTRFCWAYRRSVGAMLVTTLTTCGSFFIGATSPLPLVQSFCIFAAVVVLVDYLFCISFFASAVLVYEDWMKGVGYCCSCCGIPLREPGTCLGPGCCFGGLRACLSCCGRSWRMVPKPPKADEPPEQRAMEKFFAGPAFRAWAALVSGFYDNHKIKLILFWLVVVIGMATSAGVQLRTAKKRAPIGRENIDVIKGSDILFSEPLGLWFEFSTRPVTASIVFGLNEESPVTWAREIEGSTTNAPNFGGSSASDLAKPAFQLELLALCTAVDIGQDAADTRCGNRACLAKGSPLAGNCAADQTAWQTAGIYLREDESCVTSRYCFMEDVRYFWASKQGNCQGLNQTSCSAAAGCAYSTTTVPPGCNLARTGRAGYPGLSETEFIQLLSDPSSTDPTMTGWEAYLELKSNYLRSVNRRYEADFAAQYTGVRLNSAKTAIQFAWISFNATFPRENTVDEANEWYNRWQTFKGNGCVPHRTGAFAVNCVMLFVHLPVGLPLGVSFSQLRQQFKGPLGTKSGRLPDTLLQQRLPVPERATSLHDMFLVTQNEMVKAATMGIGLMEHVYQADNLELVDLHFGAYMHLGIICITATFLGVVPLLGWSLGENECIFMIATVGLSVDYTAAGLMQGNFPGRL